MFKAGDKVRHQGKLKNLGTGIVVAVVKSVAVVFPDCSNPLYQTNPSWIRPASLLKVEASKKQLEDMKHALGLNRSDEPTRNYFYSDKENASWNDLIAKGLAVKRRGWDGKSSYFQLTEEGWALLYENLGRPQPVGITE